MIHKGQPRPPGEKLWLTLLSVLLFSAVCAWAGDGLYSAARLKLGTAVVRYERLKRTVELEGIALRYEQALPGGDWSALCENGQRLPALAAAAMSREGEIFHCPSSALYFEDCDGYEALSPELIASLDAEGFRALLASEPAPASGAGRLVSRQEWYYLALLPDSAVISPGRCTLELGGGLEAEGRIIEIKEDENGERLAVFRAARLTEDFAFLRREKAALLLEKREGLSVPAEAIAFDEEGQAFLRLCTAAGLRRLDAEIIYKDEKEGRCLVRPKEENALRDGQRVLCPAEGSPTAAAGEREYEYDK